MFNSYSKISAHVFPLIVARALPWIPATRRQFKLIRLQGAPLLFANYRSHERSITAAILLLLGRRLFPGPIQPPRSAQVLWHSQASFSHRLRQKRHRMLHRVRDILLVNTQKKTFTHDVTAFLAKCNHFVYNTLAIVKCAHTRALQEGRCSARIEFNQISKGFGKYRDASATLSANQS